MDLRVRDLAVQMGLKVRRAPELDERRVGRSTGIRGLDRLLPWGGYPLGSVTELLGPARGRLALCSAAAFSQTGRVLWAMSEGLLNPWHFQRTGGCLERLFFLQNDRYEWAVEQALRSGLFELVVAQGTGPLSGRLRFSPAAWRRWFGAVGRGGGVLLLTLEERPDLGRISRPAGLRLRVRDVDDGDNLRLHIEIMRAAGHPPGASLEVRVDTELSP